MKVAATHFIIRAKTAKPSQVEPGEVFEPDEAELLQLTEARAVRDLTEVEKKLHEVDDAPPMEKANSDKVDRTALEARAAELKVKFRSNISDADLSKLVTEAEAKVADTKATEGGNSTGSLV